MFSNKNEIDFGKLYAGERRARKMAYNKRERAKSKGAAVAKGAAVIDPMEQVYSDFAAEHDCSLAEAKRRVREALRWWDSDEGSLAAEFNFDEILAQAEIDAELRADYEPQPSEVTDVACALCGCITNKQIATHQHGKYLCPGCETYFFIGKDGHARPIDMLDSYLAEQEYNAHLSEEVVCQHCFDKAPHSWMNGYNVCWPCCIEHGDDAMNAYMNETVQCVSCGDYHPRHATTGDKNLRLCAVCAEFYAIWQRVVIDAKSLDWVNDPSHSAVYPEDVCICDGCRNGYGICAYRDRKE